MAKQANYFIDRDVKMDRIPTISLSQIADVIADGTLVIPEKVKWKKIFYNTGQSELYDEYQHQLSEIRL